MIFTGTIINHCKCRSHIAVWVECLTSCVAIFSNVLANMRDLTTQRNLVGEKIFDDCKEMRQLIYDFADEGRDNNGVAPNGLQGRLSLHCHVCLAHNVCSKVQCPSRHRSLVAVVVQYNFTA